MNTSALRKWSALAASLALAGCASFSNDGGMDRVSVLTKERIGQPVSAQRSRADVGLARGRVGDLLKEPLNAETTVELALLNNRGLQAQLGNLGLAEADLVDAGRPSGPQLSLGRLAGGGTLEIERSVLFNVLGLLTMPSESRIARSQFERAQLQAASDVVDAATRAREAFYEAVAAEQLASFAQLVEESAQASSSLMADMAKAGNVSKLDKMRQQAFSADASSQLARARHTATSGRERLVRALGLSGEQAKQLKLPDRLPDLPTQLSERQDVEQAAMDQRLDVVMAKRDVEATAQRLGLTRVTSMVNVLDAGWQNKSERGEPPKQGFQVQLQLPLFDFGSVARARAELQYRQAFDSAAAKGVQAQSEVRESYAAYRTAFDLARRYRDEIVPLRKQISDENLLRYNGMLIDVFELLADAREQVGAVTAAVEAQRDFWLAQSRMQTALSGSSPDSHR